MAERPGIMFYFDILDDLSDFSTDEIGQLFLAMMNYGRTGEVPEFSDRGMRSVWRNMMKYVDRDQVRYDDHIDQRKYAVHCRESKKKGIDPMPFDEWKNQRSISADNGRYRSLSDDIQLSTINNQQSTINSQLSAINNQQLPSFVNTYKEGDARGNPSSSEKPASEPAASLSTRDSYQNMSDEDFEKMRNEKLGMLDMFTRGSSP